MVRSFLAVFLVALLTGCAALLIQPQDSTRRKAAKVTTRVPVALLSFGVSELAYLCARNEGGSHDALKKCREEILNPETATYQSSRTGLDDMFERGREWQEQNEEKMKTWDAASDRLKAGGLSSSEIREIQRYTDKLEDADSTKEIKAIRRRIRRVGK